MAVTDTTVEALRAILIGNTPEFQRLFEQFDHVARKGYAALTSAAFFEAVDRHFTSSTTDFEIGQYIAEARARTESLAADLDPIHAENIIRDFLGRGTTSEMDDKKKYRAQALLLGTLVSDLDLDEAGLDAFLVEARKLADRLLERHGK